MSSPHGSKRHSQSEENPKLDNETKQPSPPRIEAPDNIGDAKTSAAAAPTTTAPLAPPPRPGQNTAADGSDYFSGAHGTGSNHFNLEPNPFEQSFGNPAAETPGKGLLPPVASLTSPSSLLPGGTPGWPNSLRSGPLSPAMLTGPTGGGDYFGEPWKGGFPTPNESSLRTGLTPGGGGSMFPAPSPNSQALFNSLQSGGATPNTSEFYRAALKMNNTFGQNVNPPTSQPAEQGNQPTSDSKPFPAQAPSNQQPPQGQPQQDPFGQHDANVVTSLLGLSRADAQQNSNNQFAMPGQPSHVNTNVPQMGTQSQEASPTTKRAGKNSVTSMSGSADTGEFSESAHSEDAKPARSRGGKKSANGKNQASNGRRKADDGAVKGPASKKAKTNSGNAAQSNDEDDSEDDNVKQEGGENNNNGKKMTDEEKRKNFLERNRVAALKCRQRKKQWLANLQAKVELFSTENDALSAQITQLREEIVNLKTMLLAHKDCPVSQAQGISGMAMTNFIGDINHHAHPYGMGMPPNGVPPMGMGMQQPPPQAMQRR
ncbi:Transcription factor Jun [Lasiodiplodia theobromae]|uniref:Transcription factor atf1 n=1 Tax=Lasiodiplodia theobromae TaxID=45133 RepID=A0A5N5DLM6_9PEZI|nr:Transcription factor atf1 [Lasiodiplodia theobromae]KAF9638683.1 Transcription factor Jun [Lasiodiplodia theobromae]